MAEKRDRFARAVLLYLVKLCSEDPEVCKGEVAQALKKAVKLYRELYGEDLLKEAKKVSKEEIEKELDKLVEE